MPGFVDAHIHLAEFGRTMGECDLAGTRSREEAARRTAEFARRHPDIPCIRGRGFAINDWTDPSYPTAVELDAAVPDRPCVLRSFDGHGVWVNSAALRMAGLDARTPEPHGGVILRGREGRPTGCLLESAIGLVLRSLPRPTDAEENGTLKAAIECLVSLGHTAVHVPTGGDTMHLGGLLARIERLYPGNTCPLRIRLFAPFEVLDEMIHARASERPADRVRAAGVKKFADGSLGSRTAWLSEPYEGGEGERGGGLRTFDPDELKHAIGATNRVGFPLLCHAIGDRACAEVLEAFREAGDPRVGNRLEHAQILRPETIPLFRAAGVAASVQPAHLWTDWRASDRLLGPRRAAWCLPLRSLLDAGVVLALGSDAPVIPPDLGESLQAAVTRTDADGNPAGGWFPAQRITPREWAVGASYGAWRSIGEEKERGTLQPGMQADLTVLADDILSAGFRDCRHLRVTHTILEGELVAAPS